MTVDDIHKAKLEQKTGVILGWQNATPIENDLNNLSIFYELGIRINQLTYYERNLLGNGCYERRDEGLSHFGIDAVREMNELGILIDLSHCGDQTCYDAIEFSQKPVSITHSNSRIFFSHPRNKPEPLIRLLAEKGGVIQINFGSDFLNQDSREHSSKLRSNVINFSKNQDIPQIEKLSEQERLELKESYLKSNPYPYASIDDVIDHIDRVVQLVGINHVGLGSDFDGVGDTLPVNLKDVSMYPNLIKQLFQRGYSKSDIGI